MLATVRAPSRPISLLIGTALLLAGVFLQQLSSSGLPKGGNTKLNLPEMGKLPLAFEPNVGQTDPSVRFMTHVSGGTMYFTPAEVVFSLASPQGQTSEDITRSSKVSSSDKGAPTPSVLRLQFLSANPDTTIEGREQLPGKVNYFIGNDPSKWHTDLPIYSATHYRNLYLGIDLKYEGVGGQLKGTYTIAPEADPSFIQWRYVGAQSVHIDEGGNIEVMLSGEGGKTVTEQAPVAWQEIGGKRIGVKVMYSLAPENTVSFVSASYDHSYPLIIDPTLIYSTYLGGNGYDHGRDIAVDAAGNAYVTGITNSSNFPLQNPFQATYAGGFYDAFVTKLSATGSDLIYSTYLGGSGWEGGSSIALNTSGNAYVTGFTNSANFPLQNPFQSDNHGIYNAFVTKLSAAGSTLIYSTYLGGNGNDNGYDIAVDMSGHAYVTGDTTSGNFPLQNPFQSSYGGSGDAFVTKFSATGSTLIYSTYLGGNAYDYGNGMAVDASGNAYIAGITSSTNFPLQNPFQATYGGGPTDAFVTKLSAAGPTLIYSTYLGGDDTAHGDNAYDIAVDMSGNAYVIGWTSSTNFPLQNPFQSILSGPTDAFITKFSATGSTLIYSTYLGGNSTEYGNGLAVDATGSAYIAGTTYSINFPLRNPFQSVYGGGPNDGFVTKLSPTGSTLIYSTYLGGNGEDGGYGIAVTASSNAYVTGETSSTNFTLQNPFQAVYGGGGDAFITKLNTAYLDLPFSYDGTETTFRKYVLDTDQHGKVSSWFDHRFPDYFHNNDVYGWTGEIFNHQETNTEAHCWDSVCYDGHSGIDFAPNSPTTVLAAAAGTVVQIRNHCAETSWGCGGLPGNNNGYGNYVILYHPQIGYFTLYAHLIPNSIVVTEGQEITAGTPLGQMGHTGNVHGDPGDHIHFGVYRDNNNGQWDNLPQQLDSGPDWPVDPFGWAGLTRNPPIADPWANAHISATSTLLWRYSPGRNEIIPKDQQVTIQDTATNSSVLIAANTFTEDVGLYLLPGLTQPAPEPLRSVGHDFTMDVVSSEGLDGQSSTSPLTLLQPITLTITYTDSELTQLDPQQLSVYSYNDALQQWEPISSTVDYAAHQVTAHPDRLGQFSLLAPLLCTTDLQEPNDTYLAAHYLEANAPATSGSLQTLTDQDWFSFQADITRTYQLTTSNLATGVVTVLNLYDSGGTNLLVSNTSGGGQGSVIAWTPVYSGTYYLETNSTNNGSVGCLSTYNLGVTASIITSTPTATATVTATGTRTSTRTNTPLPTQTPGGPTATIAPSSTPIPPSATPTRISTSTNTPVPPSNTPSNTSTRTRTPLPTQTPGGSTATTAPTNTPAPPSATRTNTTIPPSSTAVPPTQTPGGSTATPPPTNTSVQPTNTTGATATVCALEYTDVPSTNTFYPFARCLACRGIISGYPCGGEGEPCDQNSNPYFRPYVNVTRGQIAKIVSNSAGYNEDPNPQIYEDVAPNNTFYQWINRLSRRGHMGGYPCGGAGEPCGSDNLPYFRPFANATRGQLAKIVSNAAGFNDTPVGQIFADVPPDSGFYVWIQRLASRGIMGGYQCGGEGEPCDDQNRPYFRPYNSVTRGQTSKIVAGAFFPDCQTP